MTTLNFVYMATNLKEDKVMMGFSIACLTRRQMVRENLMFIR